MSLSPSIREETWKPHVQADEDELQLLERDWDPRTIAMRLLLICRTNAFGSGNHKSDIVLYLTLSRLNYSCIPNAYHVYDRNSGNMLLTTNREIQVGEEITVSYIDCYHPREQRQLALRPLRLICKCPACDLSHTEQHLHEKRVRRLEELSQTNYLGESRNIKPDIYHSMTRREAAVKDARELIELLTSHHSTKLLCVEVYVDMSRRSPQYASARCLLFI